MNTIKKAVIALAETHPELASELLSSLDNKKFDIAIMNFVRELRRAVREGDNIGVSVSDLATAMENLAVVIASTGSKRIEKETYNVAKLMRRHASKLLKNQVNPNTIYEDAYVQILDGALAHAEKSYKSAQKGMYTDSVRHLSEAVSSIANAIVAAGSDRLHGDVMQVSKLLKNLSRNMD